MSAQVNRDASTEGRNAITDGMNIESELHDKINEAFGISLLYLTSTFSPKKEFVRDEVEKLKRLTTQYAQSSFNFEGFLNSHKTKFNKMSQRAEKDIFDALATEDTFDRNTALTAALNRYKNYMDLLIRYSYWETYNTDRSDVIKSYRVELKTTRHIFDSRTGNDSRYFAGLKQIKPVDEPFSYTWGGYERVFMVPPDRPNDRAVVIPYSNGSERQNVAVAKATEALKRSRPVT